MRRCLSFVLASCALGSLEAQTQVTLSPTASPSSGAPGVTSINVTGSNFPTGTITPANVNVILTPALGGTPVTSQATAITTIVGSTRRVTFTIPATITVPTPTLFNVSISGTTTTGTTFASSNTASLTINPGASISTLNPASGPQGQTVSVAITGQLTNFVQGATQANFGAGISVGGAAAGTAGLVTVTNATTATVSLAIAPDAALGPRAVTVLTGTQQASLSNGFAVTAGIPAVIQANPNAGRQGQTLTSVAITGVFTHFTQGTTVAGFGAGIIVNNTTVTDATHASANISISSTAALGARAVTMTTGAESAALTNGFTVTVASGLTITDFNPKSAPEGTLVTITGANLQPNAGTAAQVILAKQGGGTLPGAVSATSASTLAFVIPAGAATGVVSVTVNGQSATSATTLTIVPSSGFSISTLPSSARLIQGQSVSYAVQLSSTNGFSQLAQLSVTGLPTGVTASFKPVNITAGQTSILTLTAPTSQPIAPTVLTVSASAMVDGIALSQSATAQLSVQAPTTSFIGRTVVSDAAETPLAGVTATMLGKDGNGNTTGCTGNATSDAAGNFVLTNLPATCVGPQLIGFDGTTATSPAGRYAGVNLVFTFVLGQATVSRVLVHLPRIDNVETFLVSQNSASNQTHAFASIPGLSVTVYAGTTFTMPDGSTPNPFPLAAVQVPVDRLPDAKPQVPTMMRVFIVAFQPANATASQPVAVYFPNVLNTPPGTNMALMTLDPTHGQMVPYGTGSVSSDGTQIVPDADPAHPGHLYGLLHFDWHGPMPPPAPSVNPGPPGGGPVGGGPASGPGSGPGGSSGPGGGPTPAPQGLSPTPAPSGGPTCMTRLETEGTGLRNGAELAQTGAPAQAGDPVDLFSGIQVLTDSDISIAGARGSLAVVRTYRSLSGNPGPFGIGTGINYGLQLDLSGLIRSAEGIINLVMPDGNHYPFYRTITGTFINTSLPAFSGAVMSNSSGGVYNLRYKNGLTYVFQNLPSGPFQAFLSAISEPNGNSITVTLNPAQPLQITQVTDPVGRSLTFSYDGSSRITSIADPIGRTVKYTYNSQGTLASVTDPTGAITKYTYDTNNNLLTMTDARGVIQAQNTLDSSGRVIQQVRPDGGILNFSYGLLNPLVATSQVMEAQVTDSKGVHAIYRFNPNGFVTDIAATNGETRHIERSSGTNVLSFVHEASSATAYTYDAKGNVLSATDATGLKSQYTYDPTFNKVTSIIDPLGNTTRFTYTVNGNLLTTTDANGNTSTFQYNAVGLLTRSTDALNQSTNYLYDSLGNRTSVTDPLGNTISYVYDAISRLIQTKDAAGRTTSFSYDSLGRLLTRTDPKTGVTQFAYDPNGNLLSVKDARGNTTSFTYDVMNRLATRTDPLGHTDTRTYDTNGNLVTFVDRRGLTSTYTYDNLNRMVGETYQDATVSRTYDALGRLVEVNDSASGYFSFGYDLAGRLTSSSSPVGTVNYTYDARGLMASRQVAGQPTLAYSYDAAGNLASAALPQASASFGYDPRNQLSKISRLNGVSTALGYDADGRLLTLTHAAGANTIDVESYTYDSIGNRANHSTGIGQPLITQPVASQYNANNQLTLFGSSARSYDANGNLVQEGISTSYNWDGRDRLKSITTAAGQTSNFTYDFAGNLIVQADSGTALNLTKTFVLDSLTNVAFESGSDGSSYSTLSGRSIDSHLGIVQPGGQVQYGLSDAINSTVATVDQSGTTRSQVEYEPYGQTTTASSYPFQFAGRTVASTNLYYNRARFYNSQTGRFISEDPIGFAGGANLYSYVSNNPAGVTDPLGLQGCDPSAGAANFSACNLLVSIANAQDKYSQPARRALDFGLLVAGFGAGGPLGAGLAAYGLITDVGQGKVANSLIDVASIATGGVPGAILATGGYLLDNADWLGAWLVNHLTKNTNLNVQICLNPQPF